MSRPFPLRCLQISLSAVCSKKRNAQEKKESVLHSLDSSRRVLNEISKTHLNVNSLELRNNVGKSTSLVDGARRHLLLGDDSVGDGDPVIVLSEGRSLMNETSSRILGDVGIADDSESSVFELRMSEKGGGRGKTRVRSARLVSHDRDSSRSTLERRSAHRVHLPHPHLKQKRKEKNNLTHLLNKVIEQRLVPPTLHVLSQKASNLLPLRLILPLGILVQRLEQILVNDEVLISLDVVDLEVSEVGVNANGQVGREGPRSGGPGEEGGGRVVDEGEGDGD